MSIILDMANLYYKTRGAPFAFIINTNLDHIDIYGNLETATSYKVKELKWDTYDAEGWQNKDTYEFVIENEYFLKPVSFLYMDIHSSTDVDYYRSNILYKNCCFSSEYNGNGGRLTFKDCVWRLP